MIIPNSFLNIDFIQAGFCNAAESLTLSDPILMKQVHSADALILTTTPTQPPMCDALVTKTAGLKIAAKTADCAPVLFVDPAAKIVAATHAGWKGAFQGIMENTIFAMMSLGADIKNIRAAIGPHLTQKSFQVQSDMQALFPKTEQHFFNETPNGTYFDFTGYLKHRLTRIGLNTIEIIDIDTYQNNEYNSYRRDPENHARQYSFITIK